jgi:hypothetical protein
MGGWERRESTWSDGSPWVFHVAPIALPQGRDGLRGYLCWPDWRENPPPALEVGALVELDTLLEWIPPDAGAWNPEPRGVPICEIYAADALQPVS